MKVQGVIMAGGKSSRMGTNKAMMEIHNKKVIEYIIEQMKLVTEKIIIIANDPPIYEQFGYPIYQDRYTNKGPLAGLESALYHMKGDVTVVSPCDTPFIHHTVYQHMLPAIESHDAVIPKYNDRMHPLAGIYRKSIHPHVKEKIEKNELRMRSFFNDVNISYHDTFSSLDPTLVEKHFFNMNTLEEFERAKELSLY